MQFTIKLKNELISTCTPSPRTGDLSGIWGILGEGPFQGSGEKGHLFSGSCGANKTFCGLEEQGAVI